MRVLIVHDEAGTIRSLAIPGEGLTGQLQLTPTEGLSVTEVDATHLPDVDPQQFLEESYHQMLIRTIEQYKVEGAPSEPRLVRRQR